MKSVAVLILSWNRSSAVLSCIERVKGLTGADITIVVIDNASSDDSAGLVERAHPDVVVLRQPTNTGYVGGVNRGLAEAHRRKLDYAWLLNDDTTFETTVLQELLRHAERFPDSGLFAPLIRDPDGGGVQFGNGLVDWRRVTLKGSHDDATFEASTDAGATPVLTGTALLCDMRVYDRIGPFDPDYFAYWEDIDYSVRAAAAGFRSRAVASTFVLHESPERNSRRPYYYYYMIRNEALFWKLHSTESAFVWRRRWASRALEWLAENRDAGRPDNVSGCADGIWDALLDRYGMRDEHRHAPRWFVRLASARPYLVAMVIRGDLGRLARRAVVGH